MTINYINTKCEVHKDNLTFTYSYNNSNVPCVGCQRVARVKLPLRHKKCTMGGYDGKAKVAKLQKWVKVFIDNHQEAGNILMLGDVGTGKTHLACAIINEIHTNISHKTIDLIKNLDLHYYRANQLFYFQNAEKEGVQEVVKNAKTTQLLIIDELARHPITENMRNQLCEIIDYRYNEMLPTIVISNLSPEDFSIAAGSAVFSRLLSDNSFIMGFKGDDKRIKNNR